jgi:4-hydroxythreonine-4-phosphate dehydrogenase
MSEAGGHRPVLALTPGEPAGIGPDLCIKIASMVLPARIVVVADRDMLGARAQVLRLPFEIPPYRPESRGDGTPLQILHVPAPCPVRPGTLDPGNGHYVLQTIEQAVDGCIDGRFDGMVTGPVNKGAINAAGFAFTGHTEFIADRTHTPRVVMMLAGAGMRVALATTHVALRDVAALIDQPSLETTLRILVQDLARRFGVARPRILVAGLNPHAGESGYLGREEIDVIGPVLERLRGEGYDLVGPLPADTLFNPDRLAECDAVLAMYHDQGLPVLKHASFGSGINVTLGLPIIRTSVDHGTALDLAGTGRAEEGSLLEAIEAAAVMARNSRR